MPTVTIEVSDEFAAFAPRALLVACVDDGAGEVCMVGKDGAAPILIIKAAGQMIRGGIAALVKVCGDTGVSRVDAVALLEGFIEQGMDTDGVVAKSRLVAEEIAPAGRA